MLFIDIILIPTKSASASRLGGAQRSDVARNLFEIELTKFHERSRHIQQGHDLDIVHENFKPTTRSVSLYNHLRPRAFENERAERLSLSKKDASLFGRLGFRLLGRGFLLRRRLLLRRRFLLGYERSSKHTHGHRIIVSLYNSFARASSIPRAFFYFPPIPLMFPAPDRETYPRVSSSPPASSSPRASSSPPVSSWLRLARNERDVSLFNLHSRNSSPCNSPRSLNSHDRAFPSSFASVARASRRSRARTPPSHASRTGRFLLRRGFLLRRRLLLRRRRLLHRGGALGGGLLGGFLGGWFLLRRGSFRRRFLRHHGDGVEWSEVNVRAREKSRRLGVRASSARVAG